MTIIDLSTKILKKILNFSQWSIAATRYGLILFNQISNWNSHAYCSVILSGGMYLPKSDSGRIIVGTWWLVVLVIVTTYCGNLVAFLTFPKMEASINAIDQLVYENSDYTWSIRSNTYLETYLKVGRPVVYY